MRTFSPQADLSLCAWTVFLSHADLCPSLVDLSFIHSFTRAFARIYSPHARTAVFILMYPSGHFLIRFASRADPSLNKRIFAVRARTVLCYKRISAHRERTFCVPVGGHFQSWHSYADRSDALGLIKLVLGMIDSHADIVLQDRTIFYCVAHADSITHT